MVVGHPPHVYDLYLNFSGHKSVLDVAWCNNNVDMFQIIEDDIKYFSSLGNVITCGDFNPD